MCRDAGGVYVVAVYIERQEAWSCVERRGACRCVEMLGACTVAG
jgi:hypothetical protein